MKREILLLIFALIISGNVFAQNSDEDDDENILILIIEKMPSFPGGEKALNEFLSKNLRYPSNGGGGRVIAQFFINEKGEIVDLEIIQSVSPEFDNEVIRVINLMPTWEPGTRRSNPTRVKYTLPVNFKSSEVLPEEISAEVS